MPTAYFECENCTGRIGGALKLEFAPTETFGGVTMGVYATAQENEIALLRSLAADPRQGIREISKDEFQKSSIQGKPKFQNARPTVNRPAAPASAAAPSVKKFYTCGNLGDIIYCLPTIRAMGGGILCIGPKQTCPKKPTRSPMTVDLYRIIEPLLKLQPYLTGVEWVNEPPPDTHWDFNTFRLTYHDRTVNLAYAMLRQAGKPDHHADVSWLTVPRMDAAAYPVVINRTARYQNPSFPWKQAMEQYKDSAVFMGTSEEHVAFTKDVGRIRFRSTDTLLEAAQLIQNAQLFIGNQSCLRAIAEGLKVPVVIEESPTVPDTRFERPFAIYGKPSGWPSIRNSVAIITISLLCFNKIELTEKCLASVLEFSPNADIIVSDNASWDGTREWLDEMALKYSNLRILHNKSNVGFGPAHNQAFAHCRTPYFLVMNNDLVVCHGWTDRFLQAMESSPFVAQVGLANTCTRLTNAFEGTGGPPHEYCEGSLTMVRTEAVKALPDGLFADYVRFIYGEDSDLSLRLQEAGWKTAHIHLPIQHAHSSTIKKLPLKTRQYIRRVKAANHAFLSDRWATYLHRRNFGYTVLIKRKGARGDVMLTTPIVHALKKKWPLSQISIETDFPEVFLRNPDCNHAAHHLSKDAAYDLVFDLNGAYEGDRRRHVLEAFADATDLDSIPERIPRIYPSAEDFALADKHITSHSKNWICIHPGMTTWAGKNWPVENWIPVIDTAKKNDLKVVLVGDKFAPKIPSSTLQLTGMLTMHQTAAIMSACRLFIGLDSFPAHIAQAMRVPSIVLFGETEPQYLFNMNENFYPVCGNREEAPCTGEHHRAREIRVSSHCDGACMRSIKPERVIAAMRKMLEF